MISAVACMATSVGVVYGIGNFWGNNSGASVTRSALELLTNMR